MNAFPSIDVDRGASSPYKGKIYITYCDFPPATGSGSDLNTYLISSANGGSTWTTVGPYWNFYWPWEAWPELPTRV